MPYPIFLVVHFFPSPMPGQLLVTCVPGACGVAGTVCGMRAEHESSTGLPQQGRKPENQKAEAK